MIGISAVHFLLAAGFMLYFFHDPNDSGVTPSAVEKILTTKIPPVAAGLSVNSSKHI